MAEQRESIVTPEFRVSFPDVFKATQVNGQGEAKFRLTMLFSPETDLTTLRKLATNAAVAEWTAEGLQKMIAEGKFKSPFLNGESEKYGLPKGTVMVRATTKFAPSIVDGNVQPILRAEDFYGGCYAIARVHAYTHHFATSKPGVSIGFDLVQKVRDGAPFVQRAKPEEVFKPIGGAASGTAAPAAAGDPLL